MSQTTTATTTATMSQPNTNLPPSMIRRDQRPSNTTTRQRRGNTNRPYDNGGNASGHSSGGEEDAQSLSPIKSLSETLKEMNGGQAAAGGYSQQAAAQTLPNRNMGWDRPGKMSLNRAEDANGGDHFSLDDGTYYSGCDDEGHSVYSTGSTFSTTLGPWAVPLDWTASFLYTYVGFDLRACLARWGYNARMIRRVLLPRLCKGVAVLIFLSFVFSGKSGGDEEDSAASTTAAMKKSNMRSSGNGLGKDFANFDAMKDAKKTDDIKPKTAPTTKGSMADIISATAAAKEGGNSKDDSNDISGSDLSDKKKKDKNNKKKDKVKLPIPNVLANLSDLNVPYDAGTETPYFWDVHFSGETIAERVFSKCHGLAQAAEHGLQQPDFTEDELAVFDLDGDKFVNVDLSMEAGIDRAARLDLVGSRLANVIISPDLPQAAKVFTDRNQGRMFAIFRHPVDRAVSMYYYLSTATWDPMYNPKLKEMSLQEYAKSSSVENNWLTRFIVGKKSGALGPEHMVLAKKIVRNKILVGLYTDMETSLSRFDRYFGWTNHAREKAGGFQAREETTEQTNKCRAAFVEAGDDRHNHPTVEPNSKEWDLIVRQNKYDMELYEYIKQLYKTQAEQIFGVHVK